MLNREITQSVESILDKYKLDTTYKALIDTNSLSLAQINCILDLARFYKQNINRINNIFAKDTQNYAATLFYEASTRTKTSFAIALHNLGLTPIDLNISRSSTVKGETIYDTLATLCAMGIKLAIIRHTDSGILNFIVDNYPDLPLKLINAGDGTHAHPTQALLDLFTMLESTDNVKGKKITIVGDIIHSRVAKSNLHLLNLMGADVHLVGPETLLPFKASEVNATIHHNLAKAIENSDFVMGLRIQKERQTQGLIPSIDDYILRFQINSDVLKKANKNVKVLHPGPVNRNVELTEELIDNKDISLILKQVENGIPIRMACITMLLFNQ